jgi:elongator complex protein 2
VVEYDSHRLFRSVQKYSITFDALLIGHEAHITSLAWQPFQTDQSPALLSTSTDSSLIIWSPSSSLWINQQRFGDIGGQRLGGFVGGLWGSDGQEVMAWGWSGGWRRWRRAEASGPLGETSWIELGAIGGHNDSVKDLCWSPRGEFLISARCV